MKKAAGFALTVVFISTLAGITDLPSGRVINAGDKNMNPQGIKLPAPARAGNLAVEKALTARRSARDYRDEGLSLEEAAQILWAAQGLTGPHGFRTAPSAGALYPLVLYCVAGDVRGLEKGVYRYETGDHALTRISGGDRRAALCMAALGQDCVRSAPMTLVFAAVYEKTTVKYRDRGVRYVHMEAGHASQNVYLQAASLNLGTVAIGAFYDEEVKKAVGLRNGEEPLYLMPVGKM
jgi:SagB-type dehydrogenase family enzyme